jgi:hypothetical protein
MGPLRSQAHNLASLDYALGEPEWGSRAEGELGFVAFLEGDSRRAAIMVGDAFLSAKTSGDTGNQVRLLEMMGNWRGSWLARLWERKNIRSRSVRWFCAAVLESVKNDASKVEGFHPAPAKSGFSFSVP